MRERIERGESPASQPQSSLSVAELRQLISLMNGSEIEEIAIEHEGSGLKLVLRKPDVAAVGAEVDTVDVAEPALGEEPPREGTSEVRSPLVGVFRVAMKAASKPLVNVGDVVREGQIVGAIEALNVLNEVETRHAGRVKDILVTDGQPVEYNQPLLVVESLVTPA